MDEYSQDQKTRLSRCVLQNNKGRSWVDFLDRTPAEYEESHQNFDRAQTFFLLELRLLGFSEFSQAIMSGQGPIATSSLNPLFSLPSSNRYKFVIKPQNYFYLTFVFDFTGNQSNQNWPFISLYSVQDLERLCINAVVGEIGLRKLVILCIDCCCGCFFSGYVQL